MKPNRLCLECIESIQNIVAYRIYDKDKTEATSLYLQAKWGHWTRWSPRAPPTLWVYNFWADRQNSSIGLGWAVWEINCSLHKWIEYNSNKSQEEHFNRKNISKLSSMSYCLYSFIFVLFFSYFLSNASCRGFKVWFRKCYVHLCYLPYPRTSH